MIIFLLTSCVVYWDHVASSDNELTVKNGVTVGLVENTTDRDSPPKGYRRVSCYMYIMTLN